MYNFFNIKPDVTLRKCYALKFHLGFGYYRLLGLLKHSSFESGSDSVGPFKKSWRLPLAHGSMTFANSLQSRPNDNQTAGLPAYMQIRLAT